MLIWIIAVAICVLIWGIFWNSNLSFAFGILIGLPIAWFLSKIVIPVLTAMEHIPIWLPPLPLAIIATSLMVYGAIIWFKGAPPVPPSSSEDDSGH